MTVRSSGRLTRLSARYRTRPPASSAALKARKLPVPSPSSGGVASGKFVARVPKTVHAQLATRAKAEGVSLNALVLTFIAQGLGRAPDKTTT